MVSFLYSYIFYFGLLLAFILVSPLQASKSIKSDPDLISCVDTQLEKLASKTNKKHYEHISLNHFKGPILSRIDDLKGIKITPQLNDQHLHRPFEIKNNEDLFIEIQTQNNQSVIFGKITAAVWNDKIQDYLIILETYNPTTLDWKQDQFLYAQMLLSIRRSSHAQKFFHPSVSQNFQTKVIKKLLSEDYRYSEIRYLLPGNNSSSVYPIKIKDIIEIDLGKIIPIIELYDSKTKTLHTRMLIDWEKYKKELYQPSQKSFSFFKNLNKKDLKKIRSVKNQYIDSVEATIDHIVNRIEDAINNKTLTTEEKNIRIEKSINDLTNIGLHTTPIYNEKGEIYYLQLIKCSPNNSLEICRFLSQQENAIIPHDVFLHVHEENQSYSLYNSFNHSIGINIYELITGAVTHEKLHLWTDQGKYQNAFTAFFRSLDKKNSFNYLYDSYKKIFSVDEVRAFFTNTVINRANLKKRYLPDEDLQRLEKIKFDFQLLKKQADRRKFKQENKNFLFKMKKALANLEKAISNDSDTLNTEDFFRQSKKLTKQILRCLKTQRCQVLYDQSMNELKVRVPNKRSFDFEIPLKTSLGTPNIHLSHILDFPIYWEREILKGQKQLILFHQENQNQAALIKNSQDFLDLAHDSKRKFSNEQLDKLVEWIKLSTSELHQESCFKKNECYYQIGAINLEIIQTQGHKLLKTIPLTDIYIKNSQELLERIMTSYLRDLETLEARYKRLINIKSLKKRYSMLWRNL